LRCDVTNNKMGFSADLRAFSRLLAVPNVW